MIVQIKVGWAIFVLPAVLIFTAKVHAQEQEPESTVQKSIQTPSVSSLGKYGDIPVNLYTGTPNIFIPLYTLQTSAVDLPISLSYHASGIRVDDEAGIGGLGWSLNMGGVITRTVQGFPDDKFNSTSGSRNVEHTYSENIYNAWKTVEKVLGSYELDESVPDSLQDLLHLINMPLLGGEVKSIYEYDTKPDIFTFNFAGKTGKFILPSNFHETSEGELPLIPYQNLRIRYERKGQALTKFEIIDADGTTYTFDEVEETSVRKAYFNEAEGMWKAYDALHFEKYNTSWFLTKIEYPGSDEIITFEYIPHNKERKTPGSATILQSEGGTNSLIGSKQQFLFDSFLLDRIVTEKEIVQFKYNDTNLLQTQYGIELSNKTLSNIVVSLADNTEVRKWEFIYDYFESENDIKSSSHILYNATREAKLITVQEISPDGSDAIPPYRFEYLNDSSHRLPMNFDIYGHNVDHWYRYFENAAVDYWGYYNGKTGNNKTNEYDIERLRIPDIGSRIFDTPGRNWIYINMEPDENQVLNGIIRRITYPTGGYTEFDFEIHDYSWVGNENLYDILPESDINPNSTFQVGNDKDKGTVTFEVEETSIGGLDFSIRLHNPSQLEENEGYGSVLLERVSPNPSRITTLGATVLPGEISASVSADSIELLAGKYQMTNNLSLGSPDIYGLTSYLTYAEPSEVLSGNLNFEMFTVDEVVQNLGTIKQRIAPDLDLYRNKKGGGVRIKRITSYSNDSDPDPIVRHFIYRESDSNSVISERSSGVLVRPTQYLKQSKSCILDLDYCMLVQRIESNSFLPLGTTHGSHVGYREVNELLGENGEFGKIRHIYSSPIEVPDLFKQVYDRMLLVKNVVIFSQDWARGKEIRTEYYNSSGQIEHAKGREYELNILTNRDNMYPGVEVRSFISEYLVKCDNGKVCKASINLPFATVTINTTGHIDLIQETNTSFDKTGIRKIETVKQYSYLKPSFELSLLRKVTKNNSDNTKMITRYRYAHEVADDGTGIDYRPMLNLNMFSQPYSITVSNNLDQVLQKYWTLWSDSTGFWRPRGVWEWIKGDDTSPMFIYQN